MRILVLSTCYPRRSNPGLGIFAHRLNLAMTALGAECHVLQPIDWSPPPPFDRLKGGWRVARLARADMLSEVDGIAVEQPPVYLPVPSRFFRRDYWTVTGQAVASWIRARPRLLEADLLLAHFMCHEGYAGLVAARQLGMPFAAFALGDDVHAWPEWWPDRREKLAAVLDGADGLLANSGALARDALRWASGSGRPHIEVVYHGVESATFKPAAGAEAREAARRQFGLPRSRRLLLSVGWPSAAKGWLDLLDAFSRMAQVAHEWDLVAVTAPYVSVRALDLHHEIERRGLGQRAFVLGSLPPAAMPDVYRAVDAFVLASHNEGLSNAVLEAMATALPVITTDVGGHTEVIRDGVEGWIVPPRDVPALEAALRDLFQDDGVGHRLGAAARRRALDIGDYRTNAARLLAYLEAIVAARRNRLAGSMSSVA